LTIRKNAEEVYLNQGMKTGEVKERERKRGIYCWRLVLA
jgi:hypothetical protein